jgi:hypothetical protein
LIGIGPAFDLVIAATVQTEQEAREECSAYSEASMRDCLEAKAKASAALLKQPEGELRAALPNVDQWPRFVAEAKVRFTLSNREFARYSSLSLVVTGKERRLPCILMPG